MMKCNPKNLFKQKEKEKDFSLKNGALILEKSINSFNGNSLPFRIYSYEELFHATNGFERNKVLLRHPWPAETWTLYEGCHDGYLFSVKVYRGVIFSVDMIINEIAIASQMSKHKNILKFYGCCIETELPILVFEHIKNGSYYSRFLSGENQLLPLESRLRIASEVATAVTFLHQGTSRIVIHGYMCPTKVFLDDQDGAKLGGFTHSMLIPLGKDHVQGVGEEHVHSCKYLSPESLIEKRYTEKSDVYSFGVTLFEIITGKNTHKVLSMSQRQLDDFALNLKEKYLSLGDSGGLEKQLMECAKLTQMCLHWDSALRPCMLDVAKSLISIRNDIIANACEK